ncbi:hypothetical protein QN239_27945 [Mycolicibacterium sp. Y3]
MSNEGQLPAQEPLEVTEEHHKKAEDVMKSYDDSRPTVTLPGSDGTVSGTAINDWLDGYGKPRYGEADKT